ncbi:hypothetical protein [Phytobacter sp. V91]|uniref:hypothetical protein n=1 Tax=Phytobacter sp. V91 TaxID=3369425 RepID=UPI003F624E57
MKMLFNIWLFYGDISHTFPDIKGLTALASPAARPFPAVQYADKIRLSRYSTTRYREEKNITDLQFLLRDLSLK